MIVERFEVGVGKSDFAAVYDALAPGRIQFARGSLTTISSWTRDPGYGTYTHEPLGESFCVDPLVHAVHASYCYCGPQLWSWPPKRAAYSYTPIGERESWPESFHKDFFEGLSAVFVIQAPTRNGVTVHMTASATCGMILGTGDGAVFGLDSGTVERFRVSGIRRECYCDSASVLFHLKF